MKQIVAVTIIVQTQYHVVPLAIHMPLCTYIFLNSSDMFHVSPRAQKNDRVDRVKNLDIDIRTAAFYPTIGAGDKNHFLDNQQIS